MHRYILPLHFTSAMLKKCLGHVQANIAGYIAEPGEEGGREGGTEPVVAHWLRSCLPFIFYKGPSSALVPLLVD